LSTVDHKEGKPINIHLHIGERPAFAAGNSDGDIQMLQYASLGKPRGLALLIRHDDARREYAYDRAAKVGRLDKALEEARREGGGEGEGRGVGGGEEEGGGGQGLGGGGGEGGGGGGGADPAALALEGGEAG